MFYIITRQGTRTYELIDTGMSRSHQYFAPNADVLNSICGLCCFRGTYENNNVRDHIINEVWFDDTNNNFKQIFDFRYIFILYCRNLYEIAQLARESAK